MSNIRHIIGPILLTFGWCIAGGSYDNQHRDEVQIHQKFEHFTADKITILANTRSAHIYSICKYKGISLQLF